MIVKICGVSTPGDARMIADAGADWIGLNFWPGSKRFVSLERAMAIARILPPSVERVGVFVNPCASQVRRIAGEVRLDWIQFHGDEDDEAIAPFAPRAIKAIRVGNRGDLELLAKYPSCSTIVLDSRGSPYGGTGTSFEWDLAREARAHGKRIVLAGGLTPDNIRRAVCQVRPWGVDVVTGVEISPGRQDPVRVRLFVERARAL